MVEERAVWDLSSLLQGRTVEALIEEVREKVGAFCRHRGTLASVTPEGLRGLLKEKAAIMVLFSKISGYYSLRLSENTQDSEVLAASTKYEQVSNDLANRMLFFQLWFIQLGDEAARRLLEAPALEEYHYYLQTLRKEKPYTKSEEVEQVINVKSLTGSSAIGHLYEVLTSSFSYDFDGKQGLTQEEVARHVVGPDARLREAAYKTLLGKYGRESTLLAEMYKNLVLDWGNEGIKIRGYEDSLAVRNVDNDIPGEAAEALLEVVRENADVFTEYFRLKYALNRSKGSKYCFSRFHLYAPYPHNETATYDYGKSKAMVLETYKAFDQRFYDAATAIFDAQHVHSHPQRSKRSGAFCCGLHPGDIPFILLNHTGTVRDLFTMMHEFGHGIHGMLARKQNVFHYDEVPPMAETASIFGEMLLAQRFLRESEDVEERRAVLIKLLDDQYASITRQAFFVLFEQYAHERIPEGARKEELEGEWMDLLREQFGDMEIPEVFKHEWHYIPHIHVMPFYCYSYAWGNLLVLSLFDLYREQGDAFKEQYFELLSSGGNASPVELLRPFGVDPADKDFWRRGFSLIREEVEELRRLSE
ncbi:M3 family oligoendopeptidase [Candidatus Woesearchaeota archaeon]|nr:M3 family oligoendopeptidase [Candidatus Woesearchaeota archaeon]